MDPERVCAYASMRAYSVAVTRSCVTGLSDFVGEGRRKLSDTGASTRITASAPAEGGNPPCGMRLTAPERDRQLICQKERSWAPGVRVCTRTIPPWTCAPRSARFAVCLSTARRFSRTLRRHNPQAEDVGDEEHTAFWLVTAHQFAKRGIECASARDRALEIIRSGRDLALQRALGASGGHLRARAKVLDKLAEFLRAPVARVRRKTLTAPQPLLLSPGSMWRYPTQRGQSRNPYFATAEAERFVADGWGALVVVRVGRAYGWLAWYVVIPLRVRRKAPPDLKHVLKARCAAVRHWLEEGDVTVVAGGPGTLTRAHFERLGLEHIGDVAIAEDALPAHLTEYAEHAAAADISISNQLNTVERLKGPPLANLLR